ncbi:MAG: DNA-directed RNA polymerase subunit beta' [Nocardiopsis sp. BM-2018]|nr:MAG: DNA-directed RNA polymerase subunit beta' [Nocardiopsis sp. BM-2018]
MNQYREFDRVQIQIASPERIRSWSYGEITKPETINYRTLKPERDGLFDERVFGPEKDWECACGKYRGQRFASKVCERCGVEVTKSTVRRYRMGHVELATPCAHIWYVKDVPSKIGALLNLSTSHLEQVLYFARYIVTDPQDAKLDGKPLKRADLLTDDEYRRLRYGQQETYTVALGEDAVVRDGEVVEQGQQLAKGVKSKLAGIAQYRFPRRITLDYRELRDARLILPKAAWIEEDKYAGGQPIAELTADLEVRSEEEGVVELLPIGSDGGVLLVRDVDDEDVRLAYLVPAGMQVEVGSGEFVEAGDLLASAKSGTQLRVPSDATGSVRASKTKDKQVTMTLEVRWARREIHDINPTMHVMVGDGADVPAGTKVVGAIDAAQEIIAAADATVHLSEPASIIVSRARVYPYEDEPIVVNGDRVRPGDELADDGRVKSDISGRVEIDLVRNQVRVIESYDFEAKMGAEAVRELLASIDLKQLEAELVEEMTSPSRHKRAKARKRLEIVRSFIQSGNEPAWMILEAVPIMPPDLRPMVQVEGGRFATSDLNDLYRRLINRNNRLKKLMQQGAPDMIVRNEKRMLQEAVDALIDNGRRGSAVVHPGSDRPLRSLTDLLGGKQGRFRQNLLGKRVDYSGRSVIVVGPQLALHQCGVPKRMALELFKPFLFKKLEERGIVSNIKSARKLLERYRDTRDEIWDALEEVIQDRVVLLNRAPTLHRLGIQAFEPVLIEGQAIQLHPLVCAAFNADFDGDQMAIHVPLSVYAQSEARLQMLASHNLLSPAHGAPNVKADRDIILGLFVLTQVHTGRYGIGNAYDSVDAAMADFAAGTLSLNASITVAGKETSIGRLRYRFANVDEALLAAERGEIDMQDVVTVRIDGALVETSPGRCFFARLVKETLSEDGAAVPTSMIRYDTAYENSALRDLVIESFKLLGVEKTAKLLDGLKNAGFALSTTSGITIGIDDVAIPPAKKELLAEAEQKLAKIQEYFEMGFVTEQERFQQVVRLWNDTTEQVKQAVFDHFEKTMPFNPLFVMAQSGARGNPQQIRQLAGMRGLMAKPSGDTIELPIRSNFREGLDVLEYFISTHGARKGGADTALRTADSGYLTRKLVDVAHELVVREDDCGSAEFLEIDLYTTEGRLRQRSQLEMSLYGRRVALETEIGDLTFEADAVLMREDVAAIVKRLQAGEVDPDMRTIAVRSPLTCQTRAGVCRACYGLDMSTMGPVSLGEAVGVIAAESIGEPGTQLTMRTFHTGGVATGGDITQGLPRVIELVEARKPKVKAVVADLDGVVAISEEDDRFRVTVTSDDGEFSKAYRIDKTIRMLVKDGDQVEAGQQLTRGAINPHDLLETRGPAAVQSYLVDEIQRVYRGQGVSVHDKHIEVIVRQMLKYVEVLEPGDSVYLEGQTVERFDVEEVNARLLDEGKTPVSWKPLLLGITKASLTTKSWLSAASFQHTTHVLTEAAVSGKVDEMVGLKENVILGRLIPAGTGLDVIRSTRVADERSLAKQREAAEQSALRPAGAPQPGVQPEA